VVKSKVSVSNNSLLGACFSLAFWQFGH